MSDRPTEIWCDTGLYWSYKEDWSEGSWRDNDSCGGEKYVRADRIEQLEAKLAKVIILAGAMAEAIEDQIDTCDASMDEQIAVKNYRTTLAELTGDKDD